MPNKCIILGGGESGIGAAKLALAKGHEVFVSDAGNIPVHFVKELKRAGIPFEEGGHTLSKVLEADFVIKSPGISRTVPVIKQIAARNIPIFSEIEFASRFINGKIIAITGTNGKTTTTLLTHHIFESAGYKVVAAGNIGNSLAALAIEDKHDYYVVEVSSFQLEDTDTFKPWIAMILNISPDHLDRYESGMEGYAEAKFRIIENLKQGDTFIFNADDEVIARHLNRRKVAADLVPFSSSFYQNGKLQVPKTSKPKEAEGWAEQTHFTNEKLPLAGTHNAMNASAAILAALRAGITESAITKGLQTFKNHAHRMEIVKRVNGITFYNDSKATNVEAAKFALESFEKPVIWIAGGVDKGNDYDLLKPIVEQRVKGMVCLGKDNEALLKAFGDMMPYIQETKSMSEAVNKAYHLAENGDVVLLAPACASFDLFRNYEDRGEQFKAAVHNQIGPFQTRKYLLNLII